MSASCRNIRDDEDEAPRPCMWCHFNQKPAPAILEIEAPHRDGTRSSICADCALNLIKATAGMLAILVPKTLKNLRSFFK